MDYGLTKTEILERLCQFFGKEAEDFWWSYSSLRDYSLWKEIFGIYPDIFDKIDLKLQKARRIICPHCGKDGILTEKNTISKKKYKYRKLYSYHGITWNAGKYQNARWCYLNKNDLNTIYLRKKLERISQLKKVRFYFYDSLIL